MQYSKPVTIFYACLFMLGALIGAYNEWHKDLVTFAWIILMIVSGLWLAIQLVSKTREEVAALKKELKDLKTTNR